MGFIFCDRLQDRSQDRKQSQMIARRSQKIEHGAIVCDHDRRIAEVCFHIIADDRRTFCDRLRSYGNQPLENVSEINVFLKNKKF